MHTVPCTDKQKKHFRDFVDILDQRGAHLDKMKVSKAEAILWG